MYLHNMAQAYQKKKKKFGGDLMNTVTISNIELHTNSTITGVMCKNDSLHVPSSRPI